MRNEVSAKLFERGRRLGDCFLGDCEFSCFLLNQAHLLKRNSKLEGPTKVSLKEDLLKRWQNVSRGIYHKLKSGLKRNKGMKKVDILETLLLFPDWIAF